MQSCLPARGSRTLRYAIAYGALGDTNSSDNLISPNAGLGPLDDYGGPTPTLPLLAGSPAVDAGNPTNHPPTDQRGHLRPFGSSNLIEFRVPFSLETPRQFQRTVEQ